MGSESLFPLPGGLLFEDLFEKRSQHRTVFDPLGVGDKPWIVSQPWSAEGLTQPRPDPVMDRRHVI